VARAVLPAVPAFVPAFFIDMVSSPQSNVEMNLDTAGVAARATMGGGV
jgi:hypothetical protein